jgi:tRNA modification GTPase
LRVLTKADQGVPSWSAEGWIKVSCRDDHGLDVLQAALVAAVDSSMRPIAEDEGYLSTARQWHAVLTARKALDQFERAFNDGLGEECLAFEVQEAARALASIVGVITTDDMLDALFSRFCVGK